MRVLETRARRAGLRARVRGDYGRGRVMPAAYALKSSRRALMTEFARLFGALRAGCDGHAAS